MKYVNYNQTTLAILIVAFTFITTTAQALPSSLNEETCQIQPNMSNSEFKVGGGGTGNKVGGGGTGNKVGGGGTGDKVGGGGTGEPEIHCNGNLTQKLIGFWK
jgi:hypothetical protein